MKPKSSTTSRPPGSPAVFSSISGPPAWSSAAWSCHATMTCPATVQFQEPLNDRNGYLSADKTMQIDADRKNQRGTDQDSHDSPFKAGGSLNSPHLRSSASS